MESLKDSSSSRGGQKQYWIDSAKRLGLADTEHGIHFSRDPNKPPPSADVGGSSTESWGSKQKKKAHKKVASDDGESADDQGDRLAPSAAEEKEEEGDLLALASISHVRAVRRARASALLAFSWRGCYTCRQRTTHIDVCTSTGVVQSENQPSRLLERVGF